MVSTAEALERGRATPTAPLRARLTTHAANEAIGGTLTQRRRARLSKPPVIPEAAENDRKRECEPRCDREREHGKTNLEHEGVHSLVVVGDDSRAVPRTRDPRHRHNSEWRCG